MDDTGDEHDRHTHCSALMPLSMLHVSCHHVLEIQLITIHDAIVGGEPLGGVVEDGT